MGMARATATKTEPSEHPLVDHPEYVKAIGMIVLETNAVEIYMAQLLARTLSLPLRTVRAIYMTPKSEQSRIEVFKNATHAHLHVSPSKATSGLGRQKRIALNKTNKLADRALGLIRKRHRVIHDEWNFSDADKAVTRKLIDGRHGRKQAPVKIDELTELIHDLRVLVDDAMDLAEEFRESPPSMVSVRNERTK